MRTELIDITRDVYIYFLLLIAWFKDFKVNARFKR